MGKDVNKLSWGCRDTACCMCVFVHESMPLFLYGLHLKDSFFFFARTRFCILGFEDGR